MCDLRHISVEHECIRYDMGLVSCCDLSDQVNMSVSDMIWVQYLAVICLIRTWFGCLVDVKEGRRRRHRRREESCACRIYIDLDLESIQDLSRKNLVRIRMFGRLRSRGKMTSLSGVYAWNLTRRRGHVSRDVFYWFFHKEGRKDWLRQTIGQTTFE